MFKLKNVSNLELYCRVTSNIDDNSIYKYLTGYFNVSPSCRYSALTQSHARHGIYQNPGDSRSPADQEPVFLKIYISDIN